MKYVCFAHHVLKTILFEIVIAIIDLSGSMNTKDWKPSRKAGAVKANRELILVKAQNYPRDKVGIIGFGTRAEILHEPVCLSQGAESLSNTLSSLPDMGYTNFKAALELAEACLFGKAIPSTAGYFGKGLSGFFSQLLYGPVRSTETHIKEDASNKDCLRRIIMLSDGGYNEGGSPFKVAQRLKDAGVIVDTIGIGKREDINEEAMKRIASCNPDGTVRYCWIGDEQNLIRKYESLAHHIRPA